MNTFGFCFNAIPTKVTPSLWPLWRFLRDDKQISRLHPQVCRRQRRGAERDQAAACLGPRGPSQGFGSSGTDRVFFQLWFPPSPNPSALFFRLSDFLVLNDSCLGWLCFLVLVRQPPPLIGSVIFKMFLLVAQTSPQNGLIFPFSLPSTPQRGLQQTDQTGVEFSEQGNPPETQHWPQPRPTARARARARAKNNAREGHVDGSKKRLAQLERRVEAQLEARALGFRCSGGQSRAWRVKGPPKRDKSRPERIRDFAAMPFLCGGKKWKRGHT